MSPSVRVVVVDDSPFVCRLLTSYLQSSPDLQVVGTALNGARAVELVRKLHPDVITLDLEMPEMDGLEALERVMRECPTPVVLVSGVSRKAAAITRQAIGIGAVDFVLKYTPGIDTQPEALRQEIVAKVRAASQIRVVRSLSSHRAQQGTVASSPPSDSSPPAAISRRSEAPPVLPDSIVVIGASTGGPVALRELLVNLPADFPAAIIVVQHMPASFTGVLASQLNRQVPLIVKETRTGDCLQPGLALIAPGDYHLLLRPDLRTELNLGPEIKGHRPSIDVTMQSVAQIYGARTKGVVLTGMGDDGLMGLVSIRAKGGRTYAQDASSCVVNVMPQRAIEKGVVDHIASPTKIAQLLAIDCAQVQKE